MVLNSCLKRNHSKSITSHKITTIISYGNFKKNASFCLIFYPIIWNTIKNLAFYAIRSNRGSKRLNFSHKGEDIYLVSTREKVGKSTFLTFYSALVFELHFRFNFGEKSNANHLGSFIKGFYESEGIEHPLEFAFIWWPMNQTFPWQPHIHIIEGHACHTKFLYSTTKSLSPYAPLYEVSKTAKITSGRNFVMGGNEMHYRWVCNPHPLPEKKKKTELINTVVIDVQQ